MNTRLRNTLLAIALTTCFTAASQASTSADIPSVSQDPVVQHLKLSEEQVAKIQALRQGFENNVSQIKISGYQDGAWQTLSTPGNGMTLRSNSSWPPLANWTSRCGIIV